MNTITARRVVLWECLEHLTDYLLLGTPTSVIRPQEEEVIG